MSKSSDEMNYLENMSETFWEGDIIKKQEVLSVLRESGYDKEADELEAIQREKDLGFMSDDDSARVDELRGK